MKYLQPIKSLLHVLIVLVCFTSCNKDDSYTEEQLADITVHLKSTAGEFDKVFIEIEDVQFKVKEDGNAENAWISLNAINKGTYNIFDLRDDSELLIVDNFEMKPTYVYELRLVLGDNNFVDLNNTLYSLDVTNSGNSRSSNMARMELLPNRKYDFIIDIDIDNSLSFNENQTMMILDPELYIELIEF